MTSILPRTAHTRGVLRTRSLPQRLIQTSSTAPNLESKSSSASSIAPFEAHRCSATVRYREQRGRPLENRPLPTKGTNQLIDASSSSPASPDKYRSVVVNGNGYETTPNPAITSLIDLEGESIVVASSATARHRRHRHNNNNNHNASANNETSNFSFGISAKQRQSPPIQQNTIQPTVLPQIKLDRNTKLMGVVVASSTVVVVGGVLYSMGF